MTVDKEEAKRELRRNIITGAILRKLHREQGTMSYLIQTIEPYLTRNHRQLFGFPELR